MRKMVNQRLINLAEELGSDVLPRQEVPEPKPDQAVSPRVSNTKDYVVLENIACRGADAKVFERYPQLFVKKDIEMDVKGNQVNHTTYDWIPYFEDKGLFLPSFALSCNILEALYRRRDDPEINKVLMQYKDYGSGYGWHAQNTVIDWESNRIIHYPSQDSQGGSINKAKQTRELTFKRKSIKDMALEKALKNEDFREYMQNLTGLSTPKTLADIGKYFGKPAHIWISSIDEKRSAWLGCDSSDFYLDAYGDLSNGNAARGVRAEK